jgi:flagellar motility protein MotE (MotC chaperone)
MADSEPGIGKKILSFFIKENEGPARQGSNTSAPLESQKPAASAKVSNVAGTTDVDRKFVEHFVNLLEKANLPGPDYFEYKQALQNMEGLGLGEEKLFQAAWASFKAMGGVKDPTILKTSADQYLAILDKDRSSFLKDVEKAINDRVGSLQNEQKKLEESNAAFSQQIADLQKKIDENKNRLGQISGEVTEQSAKINANKDSFEITYRSFVEQISSDLTKINKHLTN